MSLQKIILDIASELGISATNADERAWLIDKINDAACEIYESDDIPGCLREATFNIDEDAFESSTVSLPYFVDKIRGLRYTIIAGAKLEQQSMRPRYHYGKGWAGNAFSLPVRKIRDRYPLKRNIINASVLTFTLVGPPETSDIVINLVGPTNNAARFNEQVTIPAGSTSAVSVGNYTDLTNIEKVAVNGSDIIITDVEDNELSVIANSELKPAYTILELADANASVTLDVSTFNNLSAIDVLYKERFTPFVNLYDEFPCPNCDRAIFYKFAEYYLSQKPGQEDRAVLAAAKSKQLLSQLTLDEENGQLREMQFEPNGVYEALETSKWYNSKWVY